MHLKLDLDERTIWSVRSTDKAKALLARAGYAVQALMWRRSPGGKGLHVVIETSPQPTSAMEVVALQAILGSDPWREMLQVERARGYEASPSHMKDAWNVLYEASPARSKRIVLAPLRGEATS